MGFETSDDAAVWKLRDDLAAVLTVDFFTPPVDDPYQFGRIAASNALSDVFAMGAQPHMALNMLALDSALGADLAADILRGGADAVRAAGCVVAGGHTIDDQEPKYGLCVFGTVHPDRMVRNTGAVPGDVLYLTKPLGSGIVMAAHRIDMATEEEWDEVIESMMELNMGAAQAMQECGVHAATDITGFGLAGHLHEMLESSGCAAEINWANVPLHPRVLEHALDYCLPSRCFETGDFASDFVVNGDVEADEEVFDARMGIICDAQTAGGMLASIPADQGERFEAECAKRGVTTCQKIGRVVDGPAGQITVCA